MRQRETHKKTEQLGWYWCRCRVCNSATAWSMLVRDQNRKERRRARRAIRGLGDAYDV